jgi:hypothetical protein
LSVTKSFCCSAFLFIRFNIKNAPTNNSIAEIIKYIIKLAPKSSPSWLDGVDKSDRCSEEHPVASLAMPIGVFGQISSVSGMPSPSASSTVEF